MNHALLTALIATISFSSLAIRADEKIAPKGNSTPSSSAELAPQPYIVQFRAPSVISQLKSSGAPRAKSGEIQAGVLQSPDAIAYTAELDTISRAARSKAEATIGRTITTDGEFRLATNGSVWHLTQDEAERLSELSEVSYIVPDFVVPMLTDAGPRFIGAEDVWNGSATNDSGHLGEGVVVGVFDSGVNWDHPAFADVGGDGYNHNNPKGTTFGLCSNPSVPCNDKLIGVYEFTVEEVNGRDLDGHGTHVSSTAIGNRRTTQFNSQTATDSFEISGVAPHANLISYKVCRADDPDTAEDEEGCRGSNILAAMDQAVADGVDIINYSLGSPNTFSPWSASNAPIARGMLDLRSAGILVVAAAGNSGPGAGSIDNPAHAPWVMAVANITHDREFINVLQNLQGGASMPPPDLVGVGISGGLGSTPIVHARDFGNALCGAGQPELQPSCGQLQGTTNPFPPGTFNGEIVVCDRGDYGRIEKGFNVLQAGAGGYILANTDAQGESIVADDHCLPAVHLGDTAGDLLRDWLDSGNNHTGEISGQTASIDPNLGDVISISSSRGPAIGLSGILKPDLAAPGTNILAADYLSNGPTFLSGTSMASPHVAGAAALLLSIDSSLTPAQLHSMLMTSARNENLRQFDATSATGLDFGAGRTRVDLAAQQGLFLNVTTSEFLAADPAAGGAPSNLNLPGLVNLGCNGQCTFSRRVTGLENSSWTVDVSGPEGLEVVVEPSTFTLNAGQTRTLSIEVTIGSIELLGRSITGAVRLIPSINSLVEAELPLELYADPGNLPSRIDIQTTADRGSELVQFDGLAALEGVAFNTAGLRRARSAQQNLSVDSDNSDPYDDVGDGAFFTNITLNNDGGVIIAETVAGLSGDIDIYVGLDLTGEGSPQEFEELCASITSTANEQCVIENAAAGTYWILAHNFSNNSANSSVRFTYTALEPQPQGLTATGPGNIPANAAFDARIIWDRPQMQPGELWYGALLLQGEQSDSVLGTVPIRLTRIGRNSGADPLNLDAYEPYPLAPGEDATVSIAPGEGHGKIFVDIADATTELSVSMTSDIAVDLHLIPADRSYPTPGVAVTPALSAAAASDTGNALSKSLTLTGNSLNAGRYYIVPVNNNANAFAIVDISVTTQAADNSITPVPGLYFNPERNGAGFNLNIVGNQLIIEWYTYLEDGTPTWYLAQGELPESGDRWNADLNFFSWNGSSATATVVGEAILTFEAPNRLVFNYRVNGRAGSELYEAIISDPSCAAQGNAAEQTGLWFVPTKPGFGYSILSLNDSQVHINYLYDGFGFPRWVLGQAEVGMAGELSLAQFFGFCPTCSFVATTSEPVGSNAVSFDGNNGGSVATEVDFVQTVPGEWMESGTWSNLTPTFSCDN